MGDSHVLMPNYVGKFGDGNDGLPNIATIFPNKRTGGAFDPGQTFAEGAVWHQQYAPGVPVPRDAAVLFYFWNSVDCGSSSACNGGVAQGFG